MALSRDGWFTRVKLAARRWLRDSVTVDGKNGAWKVVESQ
jgi:hypothetical protein